MTILIPPDRRLPDKQMASLLDLAWVHGKIGLLSFGGGMSGLVYQEVVVKRRWMGEEEFFSGLAVCQVLPGVNVGNLAVYVGQNLRGAPGAAVALGGMLAGPFFIVIAIASIFDRISGIAWISAMLDGVAAAAVGLLIMISIKGAKQAARTVFGLPVLLLTAVGVAIFHWPIIPVVLVLTPISVALAWIGMRRDV
ncbi:chromate transporter [Rhizobium sp. P32RR-XVIII]|uniref:chromate transporter n=1 Tax=Rhizobium sp. P32RR-XVIII TaxID=2726738 RepID=UPI001456ACE5|nr:chromate transporter [Rhizobium sp. P32RR-XVIII]NLS07576.1 chromate transporter [Rhizobium sp. P32RR-XVIII]